MKAGEVYAWLDQGPALLLSEVNIADPIPEDRAIEFVKDPEAFLKTYPHEKGWMIKLLETGEILDVHTDTLGRDPS